MRKRKSHRIDTHVLSDKSIKGLHVITHRILDYAGRGLVESDFLLEVSKILIDVSGCDAFELWMKERNKYYRCEASRLPKESFSFVVMPCEQDENGQIIPVLQTDSYLEQLCRYVIRSRFDPSLPFFTKNGSFWTGNAENSLPFCLESDGQAHSDRIQISGDYRSLALIPIVVGKENTGLLQLKSKRRDYFTRDEIAFYESIARTFGDALAYWRVQAALRERVKELTCLYGIARLVERPGISLEAILQGIVELLPPAWLYPEIASARIVLAGRAYSTSGFQESRWRQTANIVVNRERQGVLEVVYTEEKPELDDGPFLREEQVLTDTVAREVAVIVEQKQAEEERLEFQEQLRHADRLATIGQLAAGIAHELNEPLGNILGFAQLAKKYPRLPKQAEEDMEKIVNACLYSREVVKKLLIFTRQMPSRKTEVNLNQLIEEGLGFFESRCAKEGIELVRVLSPDLPKIVVDPAQLTQVLVNLVVNAIQAIPEGGSITVQTLTCENHISLTVEDTGIGMSEDVQQKVFLPFFTTKDINQGTGLGLAVVHGIVTSHGGSIRVKSEVGCGTRFEIQLPVTGSRDLEGGS